MTARLWSKCTFSYPSRCSREAEGKLAYWTLSSVFAALPTHTCTAALVHADPKHLVPKMPRALSLTGWDVEYLSNFPRLPICLMVIHSTMDARGRIKGPRSVFCSELKEPLGAPWPLREPRETNWQRYQGWTKHSPLQLFSCDYDRRRSMHTLATSPPQEDGILGSPQLIK